MQSILIGLKQIQDHPEFEEFRYALNEIDILVWSTLDDWNYNNLS